MTAPIDFDELYLQDSYVLDIAKRGGRWEVTIELVLFPGHILYRPPLQGEKHCYRKGVIVFPPPITDDVLKGALISVRDAAGEVDYGNVDDFKKIDSYPYVQGRGWSGKNVVNTYALYGDGWYLSLSTPGIPYIEFEDSTQ